MIGATDFHSHILPQMDDGSRSVEESLEILRRAAGQGVGRMLATPHFYANHDDPERFLLRREKSWKALAEAMTDFPELPQIELGAEVYYFAGISDSQILPELAFAGKRFVLLEMPHGPWTEAMYREMEGIYAKQEITPVIAHVDRYIRPLRTYGIPRRLAELPVLVQANAAFFLEPGTARMALRMLKEDRIQLLGSDCHDLKCRKPDLGPARRRIQNRLGDAVMKRLHRYEQMIFESDDSK